jgi:Tfp pilus assembly PilM family ATPase
MARSCGIRIGPRRFELVVLDGGAKKHRMTAFRTGEFPQGGDDPSGDAVAVLKEAIREHKVPLDATSIAIDSGLAAFRTLKLPALDDSKIEEVLKFEVESQLPQWNIDDVVVDFLVLDKTDSETNLLVTAVPKAALQREIDVCTRAGVEPLDAEIEATAMVNAALAADICHVDDAQVLVHIGEASTAVVVIDGGKVRSIRAIHIGALTHEPAASAAEAEGESPPPPPEASAEDTQRRLEQALSRIRRELGRTLSGARTANSISAVYVCGWELPDLIGTTIHDVPVYELDVFEEDTGQPAQGVGPLVVAYGVALRMLGGGTVRATLRREELRYTGTFERLELPVAVAVLTLITGLAIFNIFEFKRGRKLDGDMRAWLESNRNFLLTDAAHTTRGALEGAPPELEKFIEETALPDEKKPENGATKAYSKLEQLGQIENRIKIEIAKIGKELGNSGEIVQPQSALEALTLVMATIDEFKEDLGRIAIRDAKARYAGGRVGSKDSVEVVLNLSFYKDNSDLAASEALDRLTRELGNKPWVVDVKARQSTPFPDNTGRFTDAYTITCDLSKVERKAEVGS